MRSPEEFADLLKKHVKHAKNTCERKAQVSRIDAVCWYLSQVFLAIDGLRRAARVQRLFDKFGSLL